MTSSFDWDKYDKPAFDWAKYDKPTQKNFGSEGRLVGGKVGRALEAAIEKPSLLATEAPTAFLKTAEGLASLQDPLKSLISQIAGNEPKQLSEMSSDYFRQGLPEELHQGAEDIADIESFLLPTPLGGKLRGPKLKPKTSKINPLVKSHQERAALHGKPSELVPDTFKSGLTKPGAAAVKHPGLGAITKERQRKAIDRLDTEAKQLFKAKINEKLPLSKKIEEGFDFDKYHQEEFGRLKSLAEKANPSINVSPISKFFKETADKYRGIPRPHTDAREITKEMRSFRQNMPGDLKSLMKVRRSNSQKIKSIYDQRLVSGKRQEYVDFINELNRKIDESIGSTLPEDSSWFKKYKKLNAEFSEFKGAEQTLKTLEPLLRQKLNTATLTRLAEDPTKQKYLRLKMGDQGADEIIQIAKDLKAAREAIKSISVKKIKEFNAISPLSYFTKPWDMGRRAYGYVLSSPNKRKAFDEVLKAVAEKDIDAYQKASKHLSTQ